MRFAPYMFLFCGVVNGKWCAEEGESSIYGIRWIPIFNQNLDTFRIIDDLVFKPLRFDDGLHLRLLLPLHLPSSVSLVLLVSIVSIVSMVSMVSVAMVSRVSMVFMVTVRVWIPMSISLVPRPILVSHVLSPAEHCLSKGQTKEFNTEKCFKLSRIPRICLQILSTDRE